MRRGGVWSITYDCISLLQDTGEQSTSLNRHILTEKSRVRESAVASSTDGDRNSQSATSAQSPDTSHGDSKA